VDKRPYQRGEKVIDTVSAESPPLDEDVAHACEMGLTLKLAVKMETGKELYSLTSEALEGTYDARVSVRLMRDRVKVLGKKITSIGAGQRPQTVLESCAPYLVVECSIHKQMQGHNITGGPCDLTAAVRWLVDHVAKLMGLSALGLTLPDGSEWLVRRVDVTECYALPYEAIQEYIGTLNNASYPRRKVHRYGNEAIFAPGSWSSIKIYHKGPEFAKHDRPRLLKVLDRAEVYQYQALANGIMRVEVGIHAEQLKADFGKKPRVKDISMEYLQGVHDAQVSKLLREGKSEMRTVRNTEEVSRRLYATHEPGLAGALFGTWVRLATLGEREAKEGLKRSTWYKYRKLLEESGCSWNGSDIQITQTAIPEGFTLCRRDLRRDAVESPVVTAAMAPYRYAA